MRLTLTWLKEHIVSLLTTRKGFWCVSPQLCLYSSAHADRKIEAGELITAQTDPRDILELGELIELNGSAGWTTNTNALRDFHERRGDVTIFKSVGVGIQDVAIARAVVDQARQRGLGTAIEGF